MVSKYTFKIHRQPAYLCVAPTATIRKKIFFNKQQYYENVRKKIITML